MDLTAPTIVGTRYYGVCVVPVARESDTTNNCSSSVLLTVEEAQPPPLGTPDLVVGSPTVSGHSTKPAGKLFLVGATVRNDGNGASAGTTLRYYRSTDATITTADMAEDFRFVEGLAASGTSRGAGTVTAPATATAGTYYYGACVDAVPRESDTTNNCSTSVQVNVQPPGPNLIIYAVSVVSPSGNPPGGLITLSAGVRNVGDEASATTLRYYRSTDATITTSDTAVGTDSIEGLAYSGISGASVELNLPSTSGTYYYGACVDAVAEESDTTNNCSTSVQVDVS